MNPARISGRGLGVAQPQRARRAGGRARRARGGMAHGRRAAGRHSENPGHVLGCIVPVLQRKPDCNISCSTIVSQDPIVFQNVSQSSFTTRSTATTRVLLQSLHHGIRNLCTRFVGFCITIMEASVAMYEFHIVGFTRCRL